MYSIGDALDPAHKLKEFGTCTLYYSVSKFQFCAKTFATSSSNRQNPHRSAGLSIHMSAHWALFMLKVSPFTKSTQNFLKNLKIIQSGERACLQQTHSINFHLYSAKIKKFRDENRLVTVFPSNCLNPLRYNRPYGHCSFI